LFSQKINHIQGELFHPFYDNAPISSQGHFELGF